MSFSNFVLLEFYGQRLAILWGGGALNLLRIYNKYGHKN
jgi:hypothetical protein